MELETFKKKKRFVANALIVPWHGHIPQYGEQPKIDLHSYCCCSSSRATEALREKKLNVTTEREKKKEDFVYN